MPSPWSKWWKRIKQVLGVEPEPVVVATLAQPIIQPADGTYPSPLTVTVVADVDALVRYTLDGSTPTEASNLYAGPVVLRG